MAANDRTGASHKAISSRNKSIPRTLVVVVIVVIVVIVTVREIESQGESSAML